MEANSSFNISSYNVPSGTTSTTSWSNYSTWPQYGYSMYYPIGLDKGIQAMVVVRALIAGKLLKADTADEFMDAMDIVLKAL